MTVSVGLSLPYFDLCYCQLASSELSSQHLQNHVKLTQFKNWRGGGANLSMQFTAQHDGKKNTAGDVTQHKAKHKESTLTTYNKVWTDVETSICTAWCVEYLVFSIQYLV